MKKVIIHSFRYPVLLGLLGGCFFTLAGCGHISTPKISSVTSSPRGCPAHTVPVTEGSHIQCLPTHWTSSSHSVLPPSSRRVSPPSLPQYGGFRLAPSSTVPPRWITQVILHVLNQPQEWMPHPQTVQINPSSGVVQIHVNSATIHFMPTLMQIAQNSLGQVGTIWTYDVSYTPVTSRPTGAQLVNATNVFTSNLPLLGIEIMRAMGGARWNRQHPIGSPSVSPSPSPSPTINTPLPPYGFIEIIYVNTQGQEWIQYTNWLTDIQSKITGNPPLTQGANALPLAWALSMITH